MCQGVAVIMMSNRFLFYPSFSESGDSSVLTRWTVGQEVVGLNPTHSRNENFCRELALPGLLSPFGKMTTGF